VFEELANTDTCLLYSPATDDVRAGWSIIEGKRLKLGDLSGNLRRQIGRRPPCRRSRLLFWGFFAGAGSLPGPGGGIPTERERTLVIFR
jgi:hypothetical protein